MIGTKVSTREKMARYFVLGVKFLKVPRILRRYLEIRLDTIIREEMKISSSRVNRGRMKKGYMYRKGLNLHDQY